MTIQELREMLQSGSYKTVISKLLHYSKNVTGTNAYWNQVKQELKTIITQVGSPKIFWILSCADFHWPEFHELFSENLVNNPQLLVWLFTDRTEKFVKWWLYKSLGAMWHW